MCFSGKIKGYAAAVVSAVTFGLNPFFGKQLYEIQVDTLSVLFYRFFFAALMLGIFMLITHKPFGISRRELPLAAVGGVLLALTCLAWFCSFKVMDSGIGATIMFVSPVMVALIMVFGFHEKLTRNVVFSIILALSGVCVLCRPGEGAVVNLPGVLWVLLSAFVYAVYIVMIRVTRLRNMLPETLTFYTMGISALTFLCVMRMGADLFILSDLKSWGNALGLAFFPSLLSFLLVAVSVRYIGPTRTAILGALEPVTAVIIGIFFFSEAFTWGLLAGIVLILSAVGVIIFGETSGTGQRESENTTKTLSK